MYFCMITIIMYLGAIWTSGFYQGVMFDSYNDFGILKYTFIDVLRKIKPMHLIRAISGIVYLLGIFIMIYNILCTIYKRAEVK